LERVSPAALGCSTSPKGLAGTSLTQHCQLQVAMSGKHDVASCSCVERNASALLLRLCSPVLQLLSPSPTRCGMKQTCSWDMIWDIEAIAIPCPVNSTDLLTACKAQGEEPDGPSFHVLFLAVAALNAPIHTPASAVQTPVERC